MIACSASPSGGCAYHYRCLTRPRLTLTSTSRLNNLPRYCGDVLLDEAPKVDVIRTTVISERPKDIIIHTLKLSFNGWIWYVTVRRTQLRMLYHALAPHEYKAKGKPFHVSSFYFFGFDSFLCGAD